MSNPRGLHCIVHGRVQGVGFRYSTIAQARRFKVTGYVKNLSDGSVEVVAEGEKQDIDALSAWLKTGPPGAYVTNTDFRYTPYTGVYRGFTVDY